MSTPFLFRLKVQSYTKGRGLQEEIIPAYAYHFGKRILPYEFGYLTNLQAAAIGANAVGTLTVCTHQIYASRALQERNINFFELSIKDNRIKTLPTEEPKTVATVKSKDMTAGKPIAVSRSIIKMTCESLPPNGLVAVSLDLPPHTGEIVFTHY